MGSLIMEKWECKRTSSKCHTERSRSAAFAQAKALVFDSAQTDMLSWFCPIVSENEKVQAPEVATPC